MMRPLAWAAVGLIVVTVVASVGVASTARDRQSSSLNVPQYRSPIGFLDLHKRHPDALDGLVEFETMYTTQQALKHLTQMEDFLGSFRRLTEQLRAKKNQVDLAAAGNTAWDMQNIGFHNIPLIVEGTLLKQDYHLKQLEYELARSKRASGLISREDLARARTAYELATKRFQKFWDTRLPTD